MIQIKDLFEEFTCFWHAARGREQDEQLRLWEELYRLRHSEVFDFYFSPPHWGRRENLPAALGRYAEDMERIEGVAREVRELIPRIAERTLAAFTTREDEVELGVIAFVGAYGADGFGFPFAGSASVFLALELLAGYEPDRVRALIAHEFGHGLHLELRRNVRPEWFAEIMKDPLQLLQFASALFAEGLAVAASKRSIPGLDERAYLFYSPEQWAWCRANRAKLVDLALDALQREEQGDYFRFFAGGKPSEELPFDRTGYYVGSLAVERLLERHSLRQLAEMEPREYPGLIRQALAIAP